MCTQKLKIGIFVDVFFPMVDGVVMVVDQYAKRLMAYGDVTVFCPEARDDYYIDQSPYRVIRSKKMKIPFTDYDYSTPTLDHHFLKSLKASNLDIVHIHSPFSIGKMGVDYAKKHHIPCIATLHSQYKMDFEKRLKSSKLADVMIHEVMKVFNRCDALYAVNHKVAEIFKTYGAMSEPMVRHNGTDLMPLPFDDTLNELKETYHIKKEDKIFLFVGRIDAIKNIFFLIKSLKIVKDQKLDFKMFFIGSGPDETKLKQDIKSLGLSEHICLLGRITDRNLLARFYQLADLFLFPSTYDSSSLVQIEAASQMTPTLFIENAPTADTVIDQVNGFLAKEDPKAYALEIIKICQNEALLKEVSKNAFKDLYKTWDEQVLKTILVYEALLKQKKP